MKIETHDSFSGIAFRNQQQALNAIFLYLADHRAQEEYSGPAELEHLFSDPASLLGFDYMRMNGFIKSVHENGGGMREYGNHIVSTLSDMLVGIWQFPEKSEKIEHVILKMRPYLSDPNECEDRIVEMLNCETNLKTHFNDGPYRRILEQTGVSIQGSVQDIKKAQDVLTSEMSMFGRDGSFMGTYYLIPQNPNNTSNAFTKPFEVHMNASTAYHKQSMSIQLYHPKMVWHDFFKDEAILRGARDQFKATLESKL